jgi:hypothetical protein
MSGDPRAGHDRRTAAEQDDLRKYDDQNFRNHNFQHAVRNSERDSHISARNYERQANYELLCGVVKWVGGIISVLLVASILGGIALFSKVNAIEQKQNDQFASLKEEVDHVYKLVEPRYRGG